MRIWAVLGMVACIATANAQSGSVTTLPLGEAATTILGQPNIVPPNSTVRLSRLTFAPGVKTGVHKHLYPHYALVEEGTLCVVNIQSGQRFEVKAGDFFLEMIDTWHYGVNETSVPVKLLIIDLVPADTQTNSVAKP